MKIPAGAIDCDIHLPVPGAKQLLPYLDDYWGDMAVSRGIDRMDLAGYPRSPISVRPDWRPQDGAAQNLETLRKQALDQNAIRYAICNCLHGAIAVHSEDLGAAFVKAVNDWVAAEWLDAEPRLRASILVHSENAAKAVEEIERRADDGRFVQVLLLAMQTTMLGRRSHWPIYEAAQRHKLPIGIHAGSFLHFPPSPIGWPSYFVNDCVNQALAFQAQLMSLLVEGVFSKFPQLTVVLLESGFAWLPGFMWRADKTWRGTRTETPWLDRAPSEIVRERVRIALQPSDHPPDAARLSKVLEQIGSDQTFLFSTDYPHWRFDGDAVFPPGWSADLARKAAIDNPIAAYPRLKQASRLKETLQ